jgi:polar amino acid transport system substrate-binding protein
MPYGPRVFNLVGAALGATLLTAAFVPSHGSAAARTAPKLYSTTQGRTGASLYASKCALCHGAQLEGGAGPPLVGENIRTLGTKTHLSVGDFFTYMTTNMPMNEPASLKHDQYVAIMAFILKQNGYPAGAKPLTFASATSVKSPITSFK